MITSYSQNFEDVILWRALRHIKHGRYIDIGAQDPVIDSVSLAFYEAGWRGLHVEPVAFYAQKLRQSRPDEEVLEALVGRAGKRTVFYQIHDTGLSTSNREMARLQKAAGHKVTTKTFTCIPLSSILDRFQGLDVNWMKIDVETMEREVIGSWAPSPLRPWIVVIESTKPLLPEQSYIDWEGELIKLGYEFVYFDGLNRFYVSREHPELMTAFGPGPNVFDDFVLSASAPFCAKLNAQIGQLSEDRDNKQAQVQIYRERIAHLKEALEHERLLSSRVRGIFQGLWAWLSLKPGNRPHRALLRLLTKSVAAGAQADAKLGEHSIDDRGPTSENGEPHRTFESQNLGSGS